MIDATLRANATLSGATEPAVQVDEFFLPMQNVDPSSLSPEFAELNREFSAALAEETDALRADDWTTAGVARLAAATENAWEVKLRIDAKEVVYVKDLKVCDRANFWMLVRHPRRMDAWLDARRAAKKGMLQ